MSSAVSQHPTRRGLHIWVRQETYEGLLEYRRSEETFNDVVARLIRFARRYAPVAEVHVREEFLP
ncbi:MAG: hypothetical protein A2Y61_03945 [Chloroflexi bacterium RBG_13_60_13]|nr:MAG: hypothetical protein A2Y61_03945 [Chloroflexi bacterium RBG_13_60_13]